MTRTAPLWASVTLLILTRVPSVGLQALLRRPTPAVTVDLRSLGTFSLSAAGVFRLTSIMTVAGVDWSYAALYVPALSPFVLAGLAAAAYTAAVPRTHPFLRTVGGAAAAVAARLARPAVALLAALVLAAAFRTGDAAPAAILGDIGGRVLGRGWLAVAAAVASAGTFVCGSTALSNLTLAPVQAAAAAAAGLPLLPVLALQAVGAAAGNSVALAILINAKAVVAGLRPEVAAVPEGVLLRRAAGPWLVSVAVSTAVGCALFLTPAWP